MIGGNGLFNLSVNTDGLLFSAAVFVLVIAAIFRDIHMRVAL